MKKILYTITLGLALLTSCERPALIIPEGSGTGKFSMNVEYSSEFTKAEEDFDDFILDITSEGGSLFESFKYSEAPTLLEAPVGSYTVSANSIPNLPAAFDQPIYGGTTKFVVAEDQVTPVTVNCSIKNMKVTIFLAEEFREEFQGYKVSITNAASWDIPENILIWNEKELQESRVGFFTVAPLMVKVNAHRISDDSQVDFLYTIPAVAAADHHKITIGAQATGSISGLGITIDYTVNDKPVEIFIPGFEETPVDGGDGDEEEPEEPQPSTAPTLIWDANPSFADYPLAAEMNVNIKILAPEKIKSFMIDVDSYVLTETVAKLGGEDSWSYETQGAYTMDLIGNPDLVAALGALEVPVADQLRGQTEVLFSLSSLVPMIASYGPVAGSKHIFTLTVTDEKNQSLTKSLTFVAQ